MQRPLAAPPAPCRQLSQGFGHKTFPSSFSCPSQWIALLSRGIILNSALTFHIRSTDSATISFLLSFISFATFLLWALISLLKCNHSLPPGPSASRGLAVQSPLSPELSFPNTITTCQSTGDLGDPWGLQGRPQFLSMNSQLFRTQPQPVFPVISPFSNMPTAFASPRIYSYCHLDVFLCTPPSLTYLFVPRNPTAP